jgi:hypothetical protein
MSAYHAVGEMSAPEDRPVNLQLCSAGLSTSLIQLHRCRPAHDRSPGYPMTFLFWRCSPCYTIALSANLLLHAKAASPARASAAQGSVMDLLRDAGFAPPVC